MIKRKLIATITMLLALSSATLSAIGFGYHILEIRTTPEFSKGVFPSSLVYQFNFPVPDMVRGSKTEFAFRLDNGLEYRTLEQDPDTGDPYQEDPGGKGAFPRDYTVQFDEFNLFFAQGFVNTQFAGEDLLTLRVSIDGRFENAFERFSWMSNPAETEGTFNKRPGEPRFPDSSWVGAPELKGDRSAFMISLSAGLDINFMRDRITRRDGVRMSADVRYSPSMLQLFGVSADYYAIKCSLDASWTVFSIGQQGKRDTTWLSLVLDNSTSYSYIKGSKVPYFIQGGSIWEIKGPNTGHVITNRSSVTLYGPQINSYDCYPYVMGFFDIGYSFGELLNSSTPRQMNEFFSAVGFRAEFVIFNIASIYYEIGYVADPVLNGDNGVRQSFGFSLGL